VMCGCWACGTRGGGVGTARVGEGGLRS
jgi:hypothetical protein